ncbi:PhoH family protein [Desulforamulus aquiferis]|uniref:PhoH family protein n=1 Tax=Desulforamulus aquiferis TaxID=1397668 RepID=A0AAW7ZBC9_9FIRM|nr:PhoH family protein [Desulforamulus aquiferis]
MKTYVLDTSILLQSPQALMGFEDNIVVIPEVVLEELDAKKFDRNLEIQANVRWVGRFIDQLRKKGGKLNQGVALPNGGILQVEMNHREVTLPQSWNLSVADNRILSVALGLMLDGSKVAVVTNDIMLRIKSDLIGVDAQEYRNEQVADVDDQYMGWSDLIVPDQIIDQLYQNGEIAWTLKEPINHFYKLVSDITPKKSALAINKGQMLSKISGGDSSFYNFHLDTEQKFSRTALMDDNIPLVTLSGLAGSGKTLIALSAGLDKIGFRNIKNKSYRRILVIRPSKGLEDIGALPGGEQEKIAPWLRPIHDNLEQLVDGSPDRYNDEAELSDKVFELFERRMIVAESMAYLQGRSLVNYFVIIDEAQNLTPRQAKSIVTRAGNGTKIVMVGDPQQVNDIYMDQRSNGLSYTIETMKESPLHAHITLTRSKRSPLAKDAATRMP